MSETYDVSIYSGRRTWVPMTLSPQTVKNIHVGYLIREPQQGLDGWSSYRVVINVFAGGDVQTISKLFEAGQLVQVARPHQRQR